MKARQAKRLARTSLSVSLLVVIGAGFSTISAASDKSDATTLKSESKYVQVVVTPGESLWSIAAMVAGNGQIASVVADIVEVNRLKSADVAAGVKLLVPVNS
jgi:LysM repeat protein